MTYLNIIATGSSDDSFPGRKTCVGYLRASAFLNAASSFSPYGRSTMIGLVITFPMKFIMASSRKARYQRITHDGFASSIQ